MTQSPGRVDAPEGGAGTRILDHDLVQQLELATGPDAVLGAEVDEDVVAVHREDDGLGRRKRGHQQRRHDKQ